MSTRTLRTLLAGSAVALALASTALLGLITQAVATGELKQQIGNELSQRALELADKLDRGMAERYANIQLNAGLMSAFGAHGGAESLHAHLGRLRSTYEGYAWIGLTDREGKVLVATDGLLEGADVSQRPWFQGASRAAYVGDVHGALLLEKKLNAGGSEPLRFLDISMPVVDAQGAFAGVLGAHLDWRWVKGMSSALPRRNESEILLVSADGSVLLGPNDLQDARLPIEAVRLAKEGANGYYIERWPDGETYLTGYSQSRGYGSYPGLGWIVLERQDIDEAFAPVVALRDQFILWGAVISALFALLGWFAAARISRPLLLIAGAAESLQRGEAKTKIPLVRSYREVTVLARTLRALIAQLGHREAQLEHQATHNSLTQLPNRALLKAVINHAIARAEADATQLAVFTLDLDRFKRVNETRGHRAGDSVLRAAVERLERCIGTSGTLGHLSEDQFVAVLEEREEASASAAAFGALLLEAIAKPFVVEDAEFFLSASIGISVFPKDGGDAEALLASSEIALHQAKAQGGNRIHFFEARMNAAALERLELERELRLARERGELELHYQPQIALRTGRMVGVEALVRWRHPQRGLISPAKFIPIAETSGLILSIGEWVLNEACAQAMRWRAQGLPPLRMGVNVSVQQFAQGDLVERVHRALAASGLEPGLLKLEITESLLIQDIEQSIKTMLALSELGVHLAIDDFGTGYSSLSYLKRFPISELKIDQAFIRDLIEGSQDAAIVRAIIALGQNLDLSVIAEGVETAEQMRFLREAGCDEMQGYYFSRPLPANELAALCKAHAYQPEAAPALEATMTEAEN